MPHLGKLDICKGCGVAHRPNVACVAKGQTVEEFNKVYGIGVVKNSVDAGQPQTIKKAETLNAMWFCIAHLCWHQANQGCTK